MGAQDATYRNTRRIDRDMAKLERRIERLEMRVARLQTKDASTVADALKLMKRLVVEGKMKIR